MEEKLHDFRNTFREATNMSCKKYIFDFEGAVADTSECYRNAFSEAFSHFGIPFEESKLNEYIDRPLDRTFEKYYTGCTCRFRDFVTMFVGCFDTSFGLCKLRPGSTEKLLELHKEGCRIGIVSRTYRFYVERFLAENGLSDIVSEIRSSEMTDDYESVIRKMISDYDPAETAIIRN